jgi:beta-barrel assembly-enhancing protease
VQEVSGLFYNLGRMVGPHARKAKWAWLSATGTEAEAIKAEYEVGLDLAREIRCQLKSDPDSETSQLLCKIGGRLSARAANKLREFRFESVSNGPPNAFALPGGFIFVTRSLLELCQWNENEIAFILGHEMAHAIRGHAMERIINSSAIALGARATPMRSLLGSWLSSVGVKFLQNAYSQDNELEADTLGVLLVDAAGYDANAAIQMLARLAKLNPDNQTGIGVYFSSHPAFEIRIERAKSVLEQR